MLILLLLLLHRDENLMDDGGWKLPVMYVGDGGGDWRAVHFDESWRMHQSLVATTMRIGWLGVAVIEGGP